MKKKSILLLSASTLLIPQAAFAQAGAAQTDQNAASSLGDIIVTAQKREEKLQDVPLAVAALSGAMLERAGVTDLTDIQRLAPSLAVEPFTTTSTTFVVFMRGVGAADTEQPTRDAGVGIYLDDVYLGRVQGLTTQIADLERVEVLRGPQGTLYGRNTIGGAVKFITVKPKGEWGFKGSLDVGENDHFRALTTLDLPEIAGFSVKLSYLRTHRDGLVKNPGSGGDFGKQAGAAFRGAVRWKPADGLTIDYVYDRSHQDGTVQYSQRVGPNAAPFGFTVPLQTTRRDTAWRGTDLPLADNYKTDGHTLTAEWDIADALTLKSITAFRGLKSRRLHDTQDGIGFPILNFGTLDMNEFSEEIQASGRFEDLGIDYVIGANYYKGDGQYQTATLASAFSLLIPAGGPSRFRAPLLSDLAVPVQSDFDNRSKAIFGQVSWTPHMLDERLSLIAGGRYTWDRRANFRTQGGVPFDTRPSIQKFSSFDPTFTADVKLIEQAHVYVRYAQAYRSGGFNVRSFRDEPSYGPEKLRSYEVGLKTQFWDNRLRFNIDGFISKYKDIQVDGTDTSNRVHTVNAGDATIKGIEIDAAFAPVRGLELSGSYAYLHARPDGPLAFPFPVLGGTPVLILPHIPKHKYNLAVDYSFPSFDLGTLSLHADYNWNDEEFSFAGGGRPRPSYGLLNGRLTLSDISVGGDRGHLSASLWAKNLLNKSYETFYLVGMASFGEKRVIGVNLTYRY